MCPEASFTKEQEAGRAGAGGRLGERRQWSRPVAVTGPSRPPFAWPRCPLFPSCHATQGHCTLRLEVTPGFTPSMDGETEAWVEEDFLGQVIVLVC